jgi:uncharacterized membrane protein
VNGIIDIIMLVLFVLFMVFIFGGYHNQKFKAREEEEKRSEDEKLQKPGEPS